MTSTSAIPTDSRIDESIMAIAREAEIDLKGRRVLDVSGAGASAAPSRRWLAEAGASEVETCDPTNDAGLSKLSTLKEARFHVAVSTDALHVLDHARLETLLARVHDLLKPGGIAILRTRPVFAADAADLAGSLRVPIPHVLFDKRTIGAYLAKKNAPAPRSLLPYCTATWLMVYRCAGFDISKVVRHPSDVPASVFDKFSDRLFWFDKSELHTGDLTVVLQRPTNVPDLLSIAVPGAKG